MKTELEQNDLDLISKSIIEKLSPLIKSIREDVHGPLNTLMPVKELQKYLGVKRDYIYQKVHSRELPHFKVSGLLRFRRSEIESWLNASRQRG